MRILSAFMKPLYGIPLWCVLLCAYHATQAQTTERRQWQPPQSLVGIDFFQGTWVEAQAYAQKMNKFLFIDLYSNNCPPCERMEDVFRQADVAQLQNRYFVNFKMDGLKPEHQLFRAYLGNSSFPIFIFADANGTALDVQIGETNAQNLINMAHSVLNGTYAGRKPWWERMAESSSNETEQANTSILKGEYNTQRLNRTPLIEKNDNNQPINQADITKNAAPMNNKGDFNNNNLNKEDFKKMSDLHQTNQQPTQTAQPSIALASNPTNVYVPKTTTSTNQTTNEKQPINNIYINNTSDNNTTTNINKYTENDKNKEITTTVPKQQTYINIAPIKQVNENIIARQLPAQNANFLKLKSQMQPFKNLAPRNLELMRLAELEQSYKLDNQSIEEMIEYAYLLKKQKQTYNEVVNKIFEHAQNENSPKIFDFAYDFSINAENRAIDFVIEHLEWYKKNKRGKAFNAHIKASIKESILRASELRDNNLFEKILSLIKPAKIDDEARFLFDMQTLYYTNINDWDNYTKITKQYIDKLKITDPYLLNDIAWMYHQYISEPRKLNNALEWAKLSVQTISDYENNYTLAAVLYKLGDMELARLTAEQAIAIAQTHGGDYARAERLLDKINAE